MLRNPLLKHYCVCKNKWDWASIQFLYMIEADFFLAINESPKNNIPCSM